MPNMEQSKKSYGLIHGDLHTGNFMLDNYQNTEWMMTALNLDTVQQSYYVVDLATVIFNANLQIMAYSPDWLP